MECMSSLQNLQSKLWIGNLKDTLRAHRGNFESGEKTEIKKRKFHCGGWGLFDLGSFSKIFARGGAVSSNNTLF